MTPGEITLGQIWFGISLIPGLVALAYVVVRSVITRRQWSL